MCGFVADSDKWWTQEQLDAMSEIATSYVMQKTQYELEKSFKKLERSTRNKFIKIKYKPGKRISFVNNPIGQMKEWETENVCPEYSTGYSVIGTAYFCPCCGHNNVKTVLIESLSSIEKMVDSLGDIEELLKEKVGKDTARDMTRKMLEDSLENIISAFQKYAELLYTQISNRTARVNDFQIVKKGSELFKNACGKEYSSWLSNYEIDRMNLLFQKRHIIEHNAGIVDDKYLQNSGDTNYIVGQHVVINKSEVLELLYIIKKLCIGLSHECK